MFFLFFPFFVTAAESPALSYQYTFKISLQWFPLKLPWSLTVCYCSLLLCTVGTVSKCHFSVAVGFPAWQLFFFFFFNYKLEAFRKNLSKGKGLQRCAVKAIKTFVRHFWPTKCVWSIIYIFFSSPLSDLGVSLFTITWGHSLLHVAIKTLLSMQKCPL